MDPEIAASRLIAVLDLGYLKFPLLMKPDGKVKKNGFMSNAETWPFSFQRISCFRTHVFLPMVSKPDICYLILVAGFS